MDALYETYAQEESAAKEALITFEGKYPDVLSEDNLNDILGHLMGRKEQAEQDEEESPGPVMKM